MGEEKHQMQPAIRDQNIITANGTASFEFTKEGLTAELKVAPQNKILEWYRFHKEGIGKAPMQSL